MRVVHNNYTTLDFDIDFDTDIGTAKKAHAVCAAEPYLGEMSGLQPQVSPHNIRIVQKFLCRTVLGNRTGIQDIASAGYFERLI